METWENISLSAPAVHLVHLDGADVAQGDVEEGETQLLQTVHRPKNHRERSDADLIKC